MVNEIASKVSSVTDTKIQLQNLNLSGKLINPTKLNQVYCNTHGLYVSGKQFYAIKLRKISCNIEGAISHRCSVLKQTLVTVA